MFRLSRIFKNYDETGSLSEQINLYGFIGPHTFLTKTGEVGRHSRSSRRGLRMSRRHRY